MVAPIQLSKDDFYCQPNGQLPDQVVIHIDRVKELHKPTYLAHVKMSPYACCYLQTKKDWRVRTDPVSFGGPNAKINKEIRLPYQGEPHVIVQVYIKEPIRDEFIGECPLDLLPVINSKTRTWEGWITLYRQKGTQVSGKVYVSLNLRGGSMYDPAWPACTFGMAKRMQGPPRGKQMKGGSPYEYKGYNGPGYRTNPELSCPFCC
eukprot:Protomagalhaensia_wolfi_Nauph_80__789@NODE_1457_length_1519_cov_433_272297_g1127_i0_p1_GENE_NODE_1457_length_1519_cov_433_272297_g1127_i0NODE_1457_length_1519_cov_433_272297_g1127_i0_p1_ORF_typecomplete_len205_score31_01C2/PF00168_30/1_1e05_NODE_1457_length_1519_cov_433_272297_g1127_i07551369